MSSDTPRPGLAKTSPRLPKLSSENPERYLARCEFAAMFDAWLRRTRTSRDAFGSCAGRSATSVAKIAAGEVPFPAEDILTLDERHALDLWDDVRDLIRSRARARRTG